MTQNHLQYMFEIQIANFTISFFTPSQNSHLQIIMVCQPFFSRDQYGHERQYSIKNSKMLLITSNNQSAKCQKPKTALISILIFNNVRHRSMLIFVNKNLKLRIKNGQIPLYYRNLFPDELITQIFG